MDIVYFAPDSESANDRLLHALQKQFSDEKVEVCGKSEQLKTRLRTHHGDESYAVVCVATHEEVLIDLYFMQHLLRVTQNILILPDHKHETIALGYRIKPDFQFYTDSPPSDVTVAAEDLLKKRRRLISMKTIRSRKHEVELENSPFSINVDHDEVSNF
ncbi:MAG TPA: hypothetical protein VHO84_14615 [Syntrophorhabdaceae bacterium]|nr:hypothetical protein [Syntrophorhabdaceae bacterium]